MSLRTTGVTERLVSVLLVDRDDELDLKSQVIHGIARAVASGRVRSQERLPSVAELARALGVAPGTISAAYARLESLGVLRVVQGSGTFVRSEERATNYSQERLRERLGKAFVDARSADVSEMELFEMARAELRKVYEVAG